MTEKEKQIKKIHDIIIKEAEEAGAINYQEMANALYDAGFRLPAPLSPISDKKHRYHIVCLSGSTRFTNEMMMATWEFAKQGIIALGWCVLPTNHESDGTEIDHHLAEKEGIADLLDDEHLDKIDLADEVFVINVGGYIGRERKEKSPMP